MADSIAKWAPGTAYGPVLSQTDLYLLNPKVELHPILTHTSKSFRLNFNLATGQTGGFDSDDSRHDLPFTHKDETATLPRLQELYIITRASPWCTIVKNPRGVSMGDICATLWREYTDNPITDGEFAALSPTFQDRVKAAAASRERDAAGGWNAGQFFTPSSMGTNRLKRIDLLFDRVFFEGMEINGELAKNRLGFSAPNIFVLHLSAY